MYSRETHFVLELVQNADDNHYAYGESPALAFELSPDRIVIRNNETGFTAENVRALCDVGNSTKAKRDGFIGEKGIGFKSVFAVSDRPEIHSNGFHFRFDSSGEGRLGYVVPQWIDGQSDQAGTRIVLPPKPGRSFNSSDLSELSAELLLFLNKLRRLQVTDAIGRSSLLAERIDEGDRVTLTAKANGLSRSEPSHNATRYLRVSHTLSMTDLTEDKRPGITQSHLVLAFPLNDNGTARADATHPVYAFLPIRNVGFKFVLQADFLLSSSREDIHKNRPWNIRIRDKIAETFAAAVPHFKNDEQLACTFFEYVPDIFDVADEFFVDAATQIVTRLSVTECVQGRSGAWLMPSQILLADTEFQEIFANEDVKRSLQLEYPAQTFTPSARQALGRLGARSLAFSHVLALLQDAEHLAQQTAQWFSALYDYLARAYPGGKSRGKLRPLALIRLQGGQVKSASSTEIFFPLARAKRYGFEGDLDIVDAAVLAGPKDRAARVRDFLEDLGIHQASPSTLIDNHILPQHAGENWKTLGLDVLSGHVAYIKDHLSGYIDGHIASGLSATTALERLRNGLYLRTKHAVGTTVYFHRPLVLYLASEYMPDVAIEELLGPSATPDQFVAPTYLGVTTADEPAPQETVTEWRDFFHRIGVNRIPSIVQTKVGSVIDFDAGTDLKKLLGSADSVTVEGAIRLIDKNWQSYYGGYKTRRHPNGWALGTPSTFVISLRRTLVPTTKKGRVELSETYLDSDAVRVVFGKSPAYLPVKLSDVDFMGTVGVTHKIDAAACIRRLDQLRAAERVSITELRTLYRMLEEHFAIEPSTVIDALSEQPRVYVPASKNWFSTSEVVWESSGALLDSLYPPLERVYPEHRTFFCKHLSVARHPADEALVMALKSLPTFDATPEERQREAYHIYRRLSTSLRDGRQSDPPFAPDWLDRLCTENLFLDHAGRLVSADNDLYIDDDARLADLFRRFPQISLVPIDRAHLSAVRMLLEACRIPTIGESVRYERVSVSDVAVDRDLSARSRSRASALMRFFFHRHHSLFVDAADRGAWAMLSLLEVRRVDELSVEAHLADYSAPFPAEILRDGHVIYLHRDARAPRDKLCTELCALLGARSDVADAIHRVLFAETNDELEQYFEARGIDAIPADELTRLEHARTVAQEAMERDLNDVARVEEIAAHPVEDDLRTHSTDAAAADAAGPTSSQVFSGMGAGAPSAPLSGSTPSDRQDPSPFSETSPHSDQMSGTLRKTDRPRSSGRLLSYAEPHPGHEESALIDESDGSEQRRQIAVEAVNFVMERERQEGQQVEEMPFNNEGFDLKRTSADGSMEYIEVKGQTGLWNDAGIVLTPAELHFAHRFRERYFLYVVEFANDPERRTLYRIQDPYGKVQQFRFDSGWKAVAVTADIIEPAVGIKIECSDGIGTIVEVRRAGQFYTLRVQLGEGPPRSVLFVPGRMRLLSS